MRRTADQGNILMYTVVAMVCCLLVCLWISCINYSQLIYQSDPANSFLKSKVEGFQKELGALLNEIENDKPDPSPGGKNAEAFQVPQLHRLECPQGHLLSYWKQTTLNDFKFVSPFKQYGPPDKYVTFEPGNYAVGRINSELIKYVMKYQMLEGGITYECKWNSSLCLLQLQDGR